MEPFRLRRRGVIYVTLLMTFAVRALCLFLTVWLTAAAAFPPCCWSMVYAHEHRQTPAEHHHDHHSSGVSEPVDAAIPVLSSTPAYDCDTAFADATTTTGVVKRSAMRPATACGADPVVPTPSAHAVPRSDTSPPGSTCSPAFLSPLRI